PGGRRRTWAASSTAGTERAPFGRHHAEQGDGRNRISGSHVVALGVSRVSGPGRSVEHVDDTLGARASGCERRPISVDRVRRRPVGYITRDDADIFYKDWGDGPPVVLCHGWPLSADSWDPQMLFLASNGFRCVAHDRRGHGRSTQTWNGNEMDTYADDLAALIEALDLRDFCILGFSTGGGEVARYI